MKRISAALSVALLLTLGLAAPVFAAPPGNDTWDGRTVIPGIPYDDEIDTSEATTDADDADVLAAAEAVGCVPPAADATVWYEFTPADDLVLLLDVSASDYSAGAIVVSGTPGNWEFVSCGPEFIGWFADAGVTYTMMVLDDQLDGGGNGGILRLSLTEAPPPPTIDVTVNPVGSFNPRTGSATIRGTVTCEGEVEFAFIDLFLQQRVGRFLINGFGFVEIACDGTVQPWEVEVFGENGLFKGGHALSVTFAVACGVFDCGFDFEETTVRLRR